MEYKKFNNNVVVCLAPNEDIVSEVMNVVKLENIKLATVSGIGAVNDITLGVFDTVNKKYYSNDYQGLYEIVSLLGNISTMNGLPYLHLHLSASDLSGNTVGGHLNRAIVSATAEIFISIIDGEIDRKFSDEIGLNLIDFR